MLWPNATAEVNHDGSSRERTVPLGAPEQALRRRTPMLSNLKVILWLDPLRGDARFERIMGELRFP